MRRFIGGLVLVAGLASPPAMGVERVRALALGWDKAVLEVDGERRVLAVGQTSPEGVRLIRSGTGEAVIEIDGRREVLEPNVLIAPFTDGGEADSVTAWSDSAGFFYVPGSIGGTAVNFLVDTGANTVALNSALAERIGLDYRKGSRGLAATAGGTVRVYRVTLNTVRVGDIVLHNVAAGVIDGPHPATPLLGMSFLGRLEMKRDGRRMELIRKY